MKTVEVLGGPRDGEVVQVPDDAYGVNYCEPPELGTATFTTGDEPLSELPTTYQLPIVGFRTRDSVLKLVAAWPLYNWPTRS